MIEAIELMRIAVEPREPDEIRALARGLQVAEWRILRAIVHGADACPEVATLLRVAAIGEPPGTAERALRSLTTPGPGCRVVVWRKADAPDLATLTPWGAAELGVVLVEPAQDDPEVEPRWGAPEELPDYYVIEESWGELKRSRTRFEAIAAARAAAQERKHPGKAKIKKGRKRARTG